MTGRYFKNITQWGWERDPFCSCYFAVRSPSFGQGPDPFLLELKTFNYHHFIPNSLDSGISPQDVVPVIWNPLFVHLGPVREALFVWFASCSSVFILPGNSACGANWHQLTWVSNIQCLCVSPVLFSDATYRCTKTVEVEKRRLSCQKYSVYMTNVAEKSCFSREISTDVIVVFH